VFRINGMGGNDTIDASGFQFALAIDGGTETDIVSYAGATTGIVANLGNPAANTGIAKGHPHTPGEGLTGPAVEDFLTGDDFANRLDGGTGGADVLQGFGGNDIYYLRGIDDTVLEAVGGGYDHIFTNKSHALAIAAEIESISTLSTAGKARINFTG